MDSDPNKKRSTSEQIARIISFITISPFQIVLYMVFASVICTTFVDQAILNTISGIFYLVIPGIPIIYLSRRNPTKTSSIRREDRFYLLIIQIFGFVGALVVYYFYSALTGFNTEILFIFTLGYVILMGVCLIFTSGLKFKISLHMAGAASSIMGLTAVMGWWWGLFFLFCIPIAWARVKLKAHTLAQVIAGTAAGILIIFITFVSYGYIF